MFKSKFQVLCLWFIVAMYNEKVCASTSDINWAEIREKLPIRPDEEEERNELFGKFDLIKNGFLSLFEIEMGVRNVLKIDAIYKARPAIKRAFDMAKNSEESTSRRGKYYVELSEFRFFLQSLLQSFKCFVAFSRVDESKDRRIKLIEFVDAESEIERWVGKIDDLEAEFKKIDVNGGGYILYGEFCDWLNTKDFHLEVDGDDTLQ